MTKVTSTDISNTIGVNTNLELSVSFTILTGSEITYVTDKFLTNYTVAESRAKAIFLEDGYITKTIRVTTYHLDTINIGDLFSSKGILYKVSLLKDIISKGKLKLEITGQRWESA